MKCLFLLPLLLAMKLPLNGDLHGTEFIDPTGTYLLTGIVKKNRIMGHSGELRVRLLDTHSVALCFYINKGYPGYESGAFMDTVAYDENTLYYYPTPDSSCYLFFNFDPASVEMIQMYNNPHSGCGFGPGVMIPAVFQKSSNERPIIQDMSAHGI
jgi:hypothetical protein